MTGEFMQYRMKTHQLTVEQIEELMQSEQVGTLATLNEDGTPYAVPVHFVYLNHHVYIHGLPKGQKISNIINKSSVCFSVYHMDSLLLDKNGKPCETNTKYQSVIINGKADFITDAMEKKKILSKIIDKYTQQLVNMPVPENMINGTAVIVINITGLTGKYYD